MIVHAKLVFKNILKPIWQKIQILTTCLQVECSVRFTLSFHATWAQKQSFNQDLIVSEVASIFLFIHYIFFKRMLESWNIYEVLWQFSSWLLSIQHLWMLSWNYVSFRAFQSTSLKHLYLEAGSVVRKVLFRLLNVRILPYKYRSRPS